MKTLKLWLYRAMLRSAIRLVDFIESQCYQAQTILRGKLSPDTLSSPCQAEGSASDLGLAWRVTKVLLFLLGVVALISFFATLRTVYFITFACLCLGQWVLVFSLVRLIYRKKLSAAPSESARSKILRNETRPLSNAAEDTPASSIGPFAVASSSSPRCAGDAGETFSEWQERQTGKPAKTYRRRRGISSAEFNRRMADEMEAVFAGSRP
jgi:hypothetical protein